MHTYITVYRILNLNFIAHDTRLECVTPNPSHTSARESVVFASPKNRTPEQ